VNQEMIMDFNAHLGNYPFRRLKYNTPQGLLGLMDKVGVDKALVSRFEAIFYKDWLEANRMLLEDLESLRSRLIPCVTVNPKFPGWTMDLEDCIREAAAVRVYPNYHGYKLGDSAFDDLVEAASSRGIPVIVTVRIQDERSHPWFLKISPVDLAHVLDAAERHPEVDFVICNAYLNDVLTVRREIARLENVYVELSFILTVTLNSVERLTEEIGAEKLLLGTYMPFFYPQCAINRVKKAEINEEERELILWRNASRLLGRIRGGSLSERRRGQP